MYQSFNNNTIISKFIKDILKDTFIPTIPIWKPGDAIVKGFTYVTKTHIVKALQDMQVNTTFDLGPLSDKYFKVLSPYIFGYFYPGITSKFESQSSIYDSETHKYLGNYLRMIRDLQGIDLMQYYNCWDSTFTDKLRINYIKNNSNKFIFQNLDTLNSKKDGFKGIIVPIKFNKEYTIYINTGNDIVMTPIFYDGINVLDQSSNINKNMIIKRGTSFSQPFIYKSLSTGEIKESDGSVENLYLEKYLKLLIQIPETSINNILILEGNYLENKFINTSFIKDNFNIVTHCNDIKKVIIGKNESNRNINQYNNDLEKMFVSIPSLSRNMESKSYAFSNRLVEYLLDNVITKNETISENISRIQDNVSSYLSEKINKIRYSKGNYITGIWDNNLRIFIYNSVTNNYHRQRIDINGYVDKDTEKIISAGGSN